MKRIRRLLVVLAAAIVAFLGWAFFPESPGDLDKLIPAPGTYDVTILRDSWGVPHVRGKTGADAATNSAEVAELEHQLADAREEAHNLRIESERLRAELLDRDHTAGAARHKRQRPAALRGYTMKMISPLGDLYVTINEDQSGRPFEVFCTLGKAGGPAMADAEAIGRLISLGLRSGIPIRQVKDQLRGISCDRAVGLGPNKVLSAPDAIGQAIERYLEEKEGVQEQLPLNVPSRSRIRWWLIAPFGTGSGFSGKPSVRRPKIFQISGLLRERKCQI